jgi:hypothetical protein
MMILTITGRVNYIVISSQGSIHAESSERADHTLLNEGVDRLERYPPFPLELEFVSIDRVVRDLIGLLINRQAPGHLPDKNLKISTDATTRCL